MVVARFTWSQNVKLSVDSMATWFKLSVDSINGHLDGQMCTLYIALYIF
jgi:hypothetical protein